MAGFMGKFEKQLEGFKATRQLIRSASKVQAPDLKDLPEEEARMRSSLAWQSGLTDALLNYTSSVTGAIGSLRKAHRELMDAGLSEVGLDASVLEALYVGLSEAQRLTNEISQRSRRPLEGRRAKLGQCQEKVQAYDAAALELKHYDDKMTQLRKEHRDAVAKGKAEGTAKYAATAEQQALDRNKMKREEAAKGAAARQAEADKSMRDSESKAGALSNTAQDIYFSTTEALQRIVQSLGAAPAQSCPTKPTVMQTASGGQGPSSAPGYAPAVAGARAADARGAMPVVDIASSNFATQAFRHVDYGSGGSKSPENESDKASSTGGQPKIERSMTPGYAKSLLTSPNLLASICDKYFREYDVNNNGELELHEAVRLVEDLQMSLGVPVADRPNEQQVKLLVQRFDPDRTDGALAANRFADWFSFALRATLAKAQNSSGAP